jgi:hypothetical protein
VKEFTGGLVLFLDLPAGGGVTRRSWVRDGRLHDAANARLLSFPSIKFDISQIPYRRLQQQYRLEEQDWRDLSIKMKLL